MFKIVMIIAIIILALGWIAYGIWTLKIRAEEKNKSKSTSKHLQQARDSVSDYAEKLKDFKKPTFKRQ